MYLKMTRSSGGGPPWYAGFATMTRWSPATRLPNLNGPVPTGLFVLKSAVLGSATPARMCAGTM